MKKNMMKNYLKQMFADDPAPAAGQADGQESGKQAEEGAEKKYSDEDLDRIISAKFAKWQKAQERKISEAERLANMSAEEKVQSLEKELADLKKEKAIADISKTARGILKNEGVNVDDALVSMFVSDDADKTADAVKAFASAFKTAVQDAVKTALKGHEPKSSSGSGDGWTKDRIMAEPDVDRRQRLIREHIDLFR